MHNVGTLEWSGLSVYFAQQLEMNGTLHWESSPEKFHLLSTNENNDK